MAERNLDFDTIVNRCDTDCLKYDFAKERGLPADVLPLWVADMDFRTSSYIEDALIERVMHGVFGYSDSKERYFNAVASWMEKQHHWRVHPSWLVKTPGVVCALAMAVKAFTHEGDKVLIQQPVYYPFTGVIESNRRIVVSNDLILGDDNRYHIDFKDFENKIRQHDIKLFLLCSPHNPVGRVWSRDELTKIGEICLRYGVIVVSDEIHNDFVFRGEHTVFANISKEFADISVTCTAPSKTFNLASLLVSNIFIPNRNLRCAFRNQYAAAGMSQISALGLVACEAAYNHGQEWYMAMKTYVAENIAFTRNYIEKNIADVRMIDLEGTYLVWLDFRKLGLTNAQLEDLIINHAHLWLDSGSIFGKTGDGFQRINVACQRSTLLEALKRIEAVVKNVDSSKL
ncbi:MAG: pyridoxal phosphate-dependent aminotransferase [Bacteroidales bacterium]|nr:pyridoxal phosphate-dependent aminotransferase [Bacteroidales bacterium]